MAVLLVDQLKSILHHGMASVLHSGNQPQFYRQGIVESLVLFLLFWRYPCELLLFSPHGFPVLQIGKGGRNLDQALSCTRGKEDSAFYRGKKLAADAGDLFLQLTLERLSLGFPHADQDNANAFPLIVSD